MTDEFSNDNAVVFIETPKPDEAPEADVHGRMAMLLVESLIHGLIERSVISVADAIEIVETARQVTIDTGPELGHSVASIQKSLTLLEAISASLRPDAPGT